VLTPEQFAEPDAQRPNPSSALGRTPACHKCLSRLRIHASRPSVLPLLIMPRKRIASARITAKLGSDDFSAATFPCRLWVSTSRDFTHKAAATIEEITPLVVGSRGITGNSEEQGVSSGAGFPRRPARFGRCLANVRPSPRGEKGVQSCDTAYEARFANFRQKGTNIVHPSVHRRRK
jgi:hypothetical protein